MGNTFGKTFLSYTEMSTIYTATEVILDNDEISWSVDYNSSLMIGWPCFSSVSVAGALKEFLSLADADGPQILNFIKNRGVLGILPDVICLGQKDTKGVCTFCYREPIGVYTQLASTARNLLNLFDLIKKGSPINAIELDSVYTGASFQEKKQAYINQEPITYVFFSPQKAYSWLLTSAANWNHRASFKLSLTGLTHFPNTMTNRLEAAANALFFEPGHEDSRLEFTDGEISLGWSRCDLPIDTSPEISIEWGRWEYAISWDTEKSGQCLSWVLEGNAKTWSSPLPTTDQRPSALFNVLTFQLMEHLVLPPETYWCINTECGKPYTLKELHERIKAAAKPGKEVDYPRAPRKDTGGFCSPECKTHQAQKQWRESKRRTKPETQKSDATE